MVQDVHPKATHGTSRIQKLDAEQKELLEAMASPAGMEPAERKRQYSAMRRAIAKSCEPALLAKFQLCNDGERCGTYYVYFFDMHVLIFWFDHLIHISISQNMLDSYRWSMLKEWLMNDGTVDSISVEEKYQRWVEQLRTDRYVTVHGLHLICHVYL